MDYNQISKEDLIKAGAHFGHPVSKWNPNYKQFIVTKKNGIHIINVNHTIDYLQKAVKKISKIIQSDGNILYVGTKNQAKDAVQNVADKTRNFYITERWLGGTLTNFTTIKKSIKRLKMLEKDSNSIYSNLTKKEIGQLQREKIKLSDLHRGIKDMRHLPAALFVVDANHERIAVSEAKCLGIPTFGIVDTNTNPFILDYPIPANDDSIKTIKLILNHISQCVEQIYGKTNDDTLPNKQDNESEINQEESNVKSKDKNELVEESEVKE